MYTYYGQPQAANSAFEQAVGKKYTQLAFRNQYQREALLFLQQKEETEAWEIKGPDQEHIRTNTSLVHETK